MRLETVREIISRSDLKAKPEEYRDLPLIESFAEKNHRELPGAVEIPGNRLRDELRESSPKRNVEGVYCASPSCTASDRAAELLTGIGYHHVFDFRGGKEHWKKGGLRLETSGN